MSGVAISSDGKPREIPLKLVAIYKSGSTRRNLEEHEKWRKIGSCVQVCKPLLYEPLMISIQKNTGKCTQLFQTRILRDLLCTFKWVHLLHLRLLGSISEFQFSRKYRLFGPINDNCGYLGEMRRIETALLGV